MFLELITFGGIFFWSLVGIAFLLILINTDTDYEPGAIATFIISLFIFWGLAKTPVPDWRWPVAYLATGLAWWFFVFNVRLVKLRNYLKANPKFIENGEVKPYGMTDEMRVIYDNEPSFEKFFGRTLCWPINMIKFFFKDFLDLLYKKLSVFFLFYKDRMLGLK